MPEANWWWTEGNRLADQVTSLLDDAGAGGATPVLACLLALRIALDTGFDDLSDAPESLAPLKKAVAKAIKEFAALAGTPEE